MKEIGKALALLTQIGISMIVPTFLCLVLGSFLDKIFHTGNVFMVVFIILGICAGFRSVYMLTKGFYKNKDTFIPVKRIENKNNDNNESGDL